MAEDFISGALAGQKFQMNKMLLQEAPVKLQQEKLALMISQQTYDQRQMLAQKLARMSHNIPEGQNPLTNAANALTEVGTAELESGLVEQGTATLAKSATIQSQQEMAAYHQWQTTLQKTKFADQLLGTIPEGVSQEEGQKRFDAINAYIKLTTGKPSALEGKKYSAELVAQLKAASATKRTQAQEALTKAQLERTKGLEEADTALIKLRKSLTRLSDERASAAAKVGGDGLIPKPKDVSAVTDFLVKGSGGDSMTPTDARVYAREIALDVEKRMDKEHLTQPQAVAAAVKYAKDHGVLAGVRPGHVRPGASMKMPLPLPANRGDPKAYQDQMWYKTNDGPRWYNAEDQKLYKAGEGPDDSGGGGGDDGSTD